MPWEKGNIQAIWGLLDTDMTIQERQFITVTHQSEPELMGVSGHQNLNSIFAYISIDSVQANVTAVASCASFCQKHRYDIYVSWLNTSPEAQSVTRQRPASLSLVGKASSKHLSPLSSPLSTDPQPNTPSTLLPQKYHPLRRDPCPLLPFSFTSTVP